MLKTETLVVKSDDSRPIGPAGHCTYCERPIGATHDRECVCREKTVVVDFTVRLVVRVPDSWRKGDVDFRYNDSSWCGSNLIDMLESVDRDDPKDTSKACLCGRISAAFVREASEEDETRYLVCE